MIGWENKLPWRIKSDLRRFREITSGHAIIMGSRTFASIGRPLPTRTNIIISRESTISNSNSIFADDITQLFFASKLEDALYLADIVSILRGQEDFFVIGGDSVYKLFDKFVNKVYLTEVFADLRGDAFFTKKLPSKAWKNRLELDFQANDEDQYSSRFSIYERRERRYRYDFLQQFLTGQASKNAWIADQIPRKRSAIENYELSHQAELELD